MNCSNTYPSTDILYEELRSDTTVLVLTILAAVVFLVIMAIYLEEVLFLLKHVEDKKRRDKCIGLLALYPVVSGCSMLILLVPTSTLLGEFASSIYMAFCIFIFVRLMFDYFDDEAGLLCEYQGETMSFRTPPCCCCLCCSCTTVPVTKINLKIVKGIVLQVAVIRPILLYIAATMWTDGKYNIGESIDFTRTGAYISILNAVSTLFGMYGLIVTYRLTREKLREVRIVPKFLSMQLAVVLMNLQGLIFSALGQNGIPDCFKSRSSKVRASRSHHMLLILEMLLLSLLARYGYRYLEPHPLCKRSAHPTKTQEKGPEMNSINMIDKTEERNDDVEGIDSDSKYNLLKA